MNSLTIRVPATSANLGPGFDSLGLAFTLYNRIRISDAAGDATTEAAPRVAIHTADAAGLPVDETNITYTSALRLLKFIGREEADFRLDMWNEIPLSRGLGSSAAARVGGLVAANEWAKAHGWDAASAADLLNLSNELEGHPDNVAAALLGGLTISAVTTTRVPQAVATVLPVQRFPHFLVWIPDGELATSKARSVLPASVTHRDAVFNLSRTALLLGALATEKWELLGEALQDRLHQTQRSPLIEGWDIVERAALGAGAFGVTISGAGSSILVWLPADDENTRRAGEAIEAAAREAGAAGHLIAPAVDREGARLISE